ncbi:putative HTH-type transcriptional regulator YdfH [Pseudovibrio axinellae]|uniref:Putative HTH-type transcriptional regulator YdfH n=1 Tax=Pseudovibrio axinellae TaxID=989403 RepID=A0A165W998_9HYPH|nr:GntR family transcriptional regulator [Pseudovibrio axinellae]KZL16242.1 putative HTH-type transcriptional regulator YdfH [Pseudovibrio axinellae]SER79825.1 transcriptional regulator, GntR family [Pseudovibrio axinellae]
MNALDLTNVDYSARDRFDRMYHEIRNRICLLEYTPGTRLSEAELAEEFGVSRTPLRRVLVRLESDGLLRSVHGVGTFVTDVDITELEQTYMLRMELAELSGKLSPVRPSETLMAKFEALAIRSKQLLANPNAREFSTLIMEFFLTLLQLTDNGPLREVSERLYMQTTRIWLKSLFVSVIDLVDEVVIFNRELDDILTALILGDMQAVALIQKAHISMSFTRMKISYQTSANA